MLGLTLGVRPIPFFLGGGPPGGFFPPIFKREGRKTGGGGRYPAKTAGRKGVLLKSPQPPSGRTWEHPGATPAPPWGGEDGRSSPPNFRCSRGGGAPGQTKSLFNLNFSPPPLPPKTLQRGERGKFFGMG